MDLKHPYYVKDDMGRSAPGSWSSSHTPSNQTPDDPTEGSTKPFSGGGVNGAANQESVVYPPEPQTSPADQG